MLLPMKMKIKIMNKKKLQPIKKKTSKDELDEEYNDFENDSQSNKDKEEEYNDFEELDKSIKSDSDNYREEFEDEL